MTTVDVLVAVRDEEESIPLFRERLDRLALPAGVELRTIFIEDSSTDGTRPLLRRLAAENPRVGYYMLVRGHGQGMALTFALSRSGADATIMMDVDGSHPPEVIPEMIGAFMDGALVAQCVRRSLADRRAWRNAGARTFQTLSRWIFGLDLASQNIFYRLMSAQVAASFLKEPRYWRYLRFPLPRRPEGAVRLVPIDTVERTQGESKYGFRRLALLAVDGVLSLISPVRTMFLSTVLGAVAAALILAGVWPLALLVVAGWLWLAVRFRRLRRADALEVIEVEESANVPPERPSP
jgi:glycosyltransferase involved in cell wall biosynthesis